MRPKPCYKQPFILFVFGNFEKKKGFKIAMQ